MMKTGNDTAGMRELRIELMADTHLFLMGLDTGVSDSVLCELLMRIREKELALIKIAGVMLSPAIWNLLKSRFSNRRTVELIDTTDQS